VGLQTVRFEPSRALFSSHHCPNTLQTAIGLRRALLRTSPTQALPNPFWKDIVACRYTELRFDPVCVPLHAAQRASNLRHRCTTAHHLAKQKEESPVRSLGAWLRGSLQPTSIASFSCCLLLSLPLFWAVPVDEQH
jgi:hypothetical protein